MAGSRRTPAKKGGRKTKNSGAGRSSAARGAGGRTGRSKAATSAGQGRNAGNAGRRERMAGEGVKDEIIAIVVIAVGIFLAVAFHTSFAGAVGTGLSQFFKGLFGFAAYLLPYYFIVYGVLLFLKKTIRAGLKSVMLLVIIFLMASLLNSGRFITDAVLDEGMLRMAVHYNNGMVLDDGGLFGMVVGKLIVKLIGIPGLYIFSIVVIAVCLLLLINTPVSRFLESAREKRESRAAEKEARRQEKQRADEQRRQQMDMLRIGGMRQRQMDQPQPDGPEDLTEGQKKILDYMQADSFASGRGAKGRDAFGNGAEPLGFSLGENAGKMGFSLGEDAGRMNLSLGGDEQPLDFSLGEDAPPLDFSLGEEQMEKPKRKRREREKAQPDSSANPASDADINTAEAESFASKPVIAGGFSPKAMEEKLTKAEAEKSTLKNEDFNITITSSESYQFPPVDLLNKAKRDSGNRLEDENKLRARAAKLEETLSSFNIAANVTNVTQGPAVTRYEVHPHSGVKVKSIKNLADDIALNMEAKSIRIEAPIPGKPAVGIEIENDRINMVTVREIIDSPEFRKSESKITFAVGKDIAGKAIVADLKTMPHMLIAGSTGSGKSVCINSIIASILYKAKPDEVKLVLIDPKVVELANYSGIPHLLIPVVTEPAKAAAALNWAVAEMDERYRKFAEEGVRELASYNKTMREKGEEESVMPQVVIIIDELADLMMAAPSQVEESICRLAQKARAAGMHLIVATQRPSVDVITGVIKANIPSRIAFAVSSQFDSRTILDMAGAEKLVGKGDMLFNPLGSGKPVRVQGTFISDDEVHKIIEFVKSQVEEIEYAENVMDTIERANVPDAEKGNRDLGDELLPEAIELVVQAQQASVSMLQRRFRIGYNRAARIIDMMEDRQIIGPSEGSKPRNVLISEDELEFMQKSTEDIEA